MQDDLMKLLEEIDKAGKITVNDLIKKGFDMDSIELAGKYDWIRLYRLRDRQITDRLNVDEYLVVSPKGFEYINPIKIKIAMEQLNASIKKFNESSDKYSYSIIFLTAVLMALTVVQILLPPNISYLGKVLLIILVGVAAAFQLKPSAFKEK